MNTPFNHSGGAPFQASIWSGQVTGPGLYLGVPEKIYHSDPCPAPSLSSHVAKIALKRSVRHAQVAHPRFSEDLEEEFEDEDDDAPPAPARHLLIGSGAHSLMLQAGAPVVECKVKAFRKQADKDHRDLIIRNGGIPLRTKDYRVAKRMAEIARPVFMKELGGEFIPEAMLIWRERGMWRRGLIDGVAPNLRAAGDYKTSGRPCPPEVAARFVNANGYPFQERFYTRGFDALDPSGVGRRRFFFLFQEVEYPHAMSIVETDEGNRSLADEQVDAACNIWDRALVTGEWPAYSLEPYIASPKSWDLSDWEARAMVDDTLNPIEMEMPA